MYKTSTLSVECCGTCFTSFPSWTDNGRIISKLERCVNCLQAEGGLTQELLDYAFSCS